MHIDDVDKMYGPEVLRTWFGRRGFANLTTNNHEIIY